MGKKKNESMPLSVNWSARDDRELKVMLQDEIKKLSGEIRSASNPSRKRKLRDRRKKYRGLLKKVESGDYGSEQFFLNEQNRGVYVNPYPAESEAVSAYDDISFKYDEYFRKKRYYGAALPLLLIVLFAAILILPFLGNIIPSSALNDLGEESIHIGALFTYKLDSSHDAIVPNDGNWPIGVWAEGKFLEQGVKYKDAAGNEPESVSLYRELGLRSIDVTGIDLLKAFFRTELFMKNGQLTQIDFIENLPGMQGNSWYYVRFMLGKDMTAVKDSNGNYNGDAVMRIVSTLAIAYGYTIGFLAALAALLFSIASLFGYVARRIHVLPLIALLINATLIVLPAFLPLDQMGIGDSFRGFFSLTGKNFMENETAQVMAGLLPIVTTALSLVALLLPILFKNKAPKYQTYVPKGNKPRRGTYDKLLTEND